VATWNWTLVTPAASAFFFACSIEGAWESIPWMVEFG
jgi:hypothetical protein